MASLTRMIVSVIIFTVLVLFSSHHYLRSLQYGPLKVKQLYPQGGAVTVLPPPPGDNLHLQIPTGKQKPPQRSNCSPSTHILFPKPHKCGGSTLENVLYRYGVKYNLDFVMPKRDHYLSGSLNPIVKRSTLIPSSDGQYDLLCNNVIFTSDLTKLLPNDSFTFTVVRDPATQFESLFTFFDVSTELKIPKGPESMIKVVNDFDFYFFNRKRKPKWIHNQMLTDLGLPRAKQEDKTAVLNYIKFVDETFDFVMIYEYYMESMVLLREALCFSWEDIAFVTSNERVGKARPLTQEMREKIYKFNWADKMLYDHFKPKFEKRLEEYGRERMKNDVAYLQSLNKKLLADCAIIKVTRTNHKKFKTWLNKAMAYEIPPEMESNSTCARLIMPEIPHTNFVRDRQIQRSLNTNRDLYLKEANIRWKKLVSR